MHAGFSDPQGPKAWRAAPYAVAVFVMLFTMFGPLEGLAALMTGLGAFAMFNLLGVFSRRQRAPRAAYLELGPGYVVVMNAGTRNQRIRAGDIIGATTAQTASGFVLSLQHRRRDQPIALTLVSEADADAVRHALGIGHGGFGTLAWRTQTDSTHRTAVVGRILAATFSVLTVVCTLGISTNAGLVVALFLGTFGAVGTLLGLVGLSSAAREPSLVMTTEGLRLETPLGWFALPYAAIGEAAAHDHAFSFVAPEPYPTLFVQRVGPLFGGPSSYDGEIILAQVKAAAQRARGLGRQKNDVTGRVDVLRRKGESPRDWLVRLDVAGQMLGAGPGYRGQTLDSEDLWSILEDPEAEGDLRAAAARVLRHSPAPDARLRINAAVAAVRDESTNRRLRIAVRDDLDGASQELAFLDAAEHAEVAEMRARQHAGPTQGR